MADPALVAVMSRLTSDIVVDVERTVRAIWENIPDLSDEAADAAIAQVVPTVNGAQRLVGTLETQYLNRVTGLNLHTATVTLLAPEARWNRSPVLQARRLVSEGQDNVVAISEAAARAAQVHSGDVLRTRDDLMSAYGGAVEPIRAIRWAKVPQPNACSWCRTVSTQLYQSAQRMPVHLNDRCGVNAVTPADDLSGFTNVSTAFENTRWRSRVSTDEMREAQAQFGANAERLAADAQSRMLAQAA